MSKVVIPAILGATILVIGFFAIMPVYEASTIHFTSIIPTLAGANLLRIETAMDDFSTDQTGFDLIVTFSVILKN